MELVAPMGRVFFLLQIAQNVVGANCIRPYFYFGIFGGVEEETELSDPKNPPSPLYKRGRKPLSEQPAKVELRNQAHSSIENSQLNGIGLGPAVF